MSPNSAFLLLLVPFYSSLDFVQNWLSEMVPKKLKLKPICISWSKKKKQWHQLSHSTVTGTLDIDNKNGDFLKNEFFSESRKIALCGSNHILNYLGALCYFHGVCWCERLNLYNLVHFNSYQELSTSWRLSVFGGYLKMYCQFCANVGWQWRQMGRFKYPWSRLNAPDY